MTLRRKLLAELGPERTPDLVRAGKPGWLGDPILYLIKNDPFVKGKIVHACDPSDHELAWLYRNCLFTLYPSVYEGWGLPVEESFAYGKLCVTTTASSLPEVGGEFADYVEPDDLEGLTAAIRRAFDPAYRQERERLIREKFRPNTWRQTTAQIQAMLARHFDLSAAAASDRSAEPKRIPSHQWDGKPQPADVRSYRVRVSR
jgi:glycosyltransferase involved in cell wall biosynthesis